MNILLLSTTIFCTTNPVSGYSRNFEAYFLQRLNDLEVNLKKFIKEEVEAKSKESYELQMKLYQTFNEQNKPTKRDDSNPLLKFLPYIPELTGGNLDPSLLNLFLSYNNQSQDNVIPLLLRALNSRSSPPQQSQNPVLGFLTNLLTNPTIDNDTKSSIAFEYIKHNLTRPQDPNCPFSSTQVPLCNPQAPLSNLQAPLSNAYGPTFNPQPASAPVNTYGPSAPVQPTTFATNTVPCTGQGFSCPLQGVETREYGRNYGKRP